MSGFRLRDAVIGVKAQGLGSATDRDSQLGQVVNEHRSGRESIDISGKLGGVHWPWTGWLGCGVLGAGFVGGYV